MPKYARCRSLSYFCSGLHGCADCKWRARTNSRCQNCPHRFALRGDFGDWTGTTRRRLSVTGCGSAVIAEAADAEQRRRHHSRTTLQTATYRFSAPATRAGGLALVPIAPLLEFNLCWRHCFEFKRLAEGDHAIFVCSFPSSADPSDEQCDI